MPSHRWAPLGVAALFTTSGLLHLVRPEVYMPLVPRSLPGPQEIVYLTGLAELICAAGLVRGSRWAGPASAALLVAILPGNVQAAIDIDADPGSPSWLVAGAWLRIPLQIPLIWAALQRPATRPSA